MIKVLAAGAVALMMASVAIAAEDYFGEGTVDGVKAKEKKLTITHGPIKGLMDAMTMEFMVVDPAMLEEVKAGSKIKFTLSKDRNGNVLISDLEPLTSASAKR